MSLLATFDKLMDFSSKVAEFQKLIAVPHGDATFFKTNFETVT